MQPRSALRSDLNWKRLKMDGVATSMLTKTCRLCRGLNLCAPKMIWPTSKRNCRKWILLIIALEKERTLEFLQIHKFYSFGFVTESLSMGCKDTLLPEPFLKNHTVNCVIFEKNTRHSYNDNLCLFRAIAIHLHGKDKLDKGSSIFSILFSLTARKELT